MRRGLLALLAVSAAGCAAPSYGPRFHPGMGMMRACAPEIARDCPGLSEQEHLKIRLCLDRDARRLSVHCQKARIKLEGRAHVWAGLGYAGPIAPEASTSTAAGRPR